MKDGDRCGNESRGVTRRTAMPVSRSRAELYVLWRCVHSKGHSRISGLSEDGYGFADVAADMLCAYLQCAPR